MMKNLDLQKFKYPKDIDQELVPFLDAANSVPGVRTMFCCSGHGNSMFYVMFACCNEIVASSIFKIFGIPVPKRLKFVPRYSQKHIRERTIRSKDNTSSLLFWMILRHLELEDFAFRRQFLYQYTLNGLEL